MDGLAISHYEYTWECHPVFRLNLVNFNTCSATGLLSILEQHIAYWEEIYGEDIPGLDLAQRFYGVIKIHTVYRQWLYYFRQVI